MSEIFSDGEVLGAVVMCLCVLIPMLVSVAWEKWKGNK
jgi:hypothetical protein